MELAALAAPALVPQAVGAALGVPEAPGRTLTDTLGRALRTRRLLLVLDNCEHLLDACAALAEALLKAGPGVRVLATSRRPLGLAGEATWWVPPLAWPAGPAGEVLAPEALPPPEALLEYGAVRLFVERARDVWPAFALTAANAPAVVQVCARLDGLPLALELAARQVVVLPPGELAARLDARLRLLTGGDPAAHPRQRTLAATLDWSHALLGEAERALFRRLSVFAGGFDLEAAEAVCADGPAGPTAGAGPVPPAAPGGAAGGGGACRSRLSWRPCAAWWTSRWWWPTPTRPRRRATGCWRRCASTPPSACERRAEAAAVRGRHAAGPWGWRRRRRPASWGATSRAGWRAWTPSRTTSAVPWAGACGAPRRRCAWPAGCGPTGASASATPRAPTGWPTPWRWPRSRGGRAPGPGRPWGRASWPATGATRRRRGGTWRPAWPAARALGETGLVAWALRDLGLLRLQLGELGAAEGLLAEGVALARAAGDERGAAAALAIRATVAARCRDFGRARALHEESLAAAREAGDPWLLWTVLHQLGTTAVDQGDLDAAGPVLEEGLALARDLGLPTRAAHFEFLLGRVALARGEPERALPLLEALRAAASEAEGPDTAWGLPAALADLGRAAHARGQPAEAAALLGQALRLHQGLGEPLGVVECLEALAAGGGGAGPGPSGPTPGGGRGGALGAGRPAQAHISARDRRRRGRRPGGPGAPGLRRRPGGGRGPLPGGGRRRGPTRGPAGRLLSAPGAWPPRCPRPSCRYCCRPCPPARWCCWRPPGGRPRAILRSRADAARSVTAGAPIGAPIGAPMAPGVRGVCASLRERADALQERWGVRGR